MTTPAAAAARALLRRPARRPGDGQPPVSDVSRRLRAVVAYDGSAFAGWQRQRDVVAVQEIVEAALAEATRLPVTVAAAGRTDAGVHAAGQVIAFDTTSALPPDAIRHLCDHVLPETVRVLALSEAPPGFDPQRACVRKLYRYLLRPGAQPVPSWRHTAWQMAKPLEPDAMRSAAALLLGTHDFRSFRNDPGPERRDEDTVRRIDRLDVLQAGDLLAIEAEGPGFLYMMVRNLAAALVAVGGGAESPEWVVRVRDARDRSLLPPPAPPGGLTLVRVEYDPPWPAS